jgi:hypothetical protein
MGGIFEIIQDEAHRKNLKRLSKYKEKYKSILYEPSEYTYCEDEKCECIRKIRDSFIINGRVPQIDTN